MVDARDEDNGEINEHMLEPCKNSDCIKEWKSFREEEAEAAMSSSDESCKKR